MCQTRCPAGSRVGQCRVDTRRCQRSPTDLLFQQRFASSLSRRTPASSCSQLGKHYSEVTIVQPDAVESPSSGLFSKYQASRSRRRDRQLSTRRRSLCRQVAHRLPGLDKLLTWYANFMSAACLWPSPARTTDGMCPSTRPSPATIWVE